MAFAFFRLPIASHFSLMPYHSQTPNLSAKQQQVAVYRLSLRKKTYYLHITHHHDPSTSHWITFKSLPKSDDRPVRVYVVTGCRGHRLSCSEACSQSQTISSKAHLQFPAPILIFPIIFSYFLRCLLWLCAKCFTRIICVI